MPSLAELPKYKETYHPMYYIKYVSHAHIVNTITNLSQGQGQK